MMTEGSDGDFDIAVVERISTVAQNLSAGRKLTDLVSPAFTFLDAHDCRSHEFGVTKCKSRPSRNESQPRVRHLGVG